MAITTNTPMYDNFINGEWVPSSTGKTFTNVNPANRDDIVGYFQQSDLKDLNAAVEAAISAQTAWAATPPPERGEVLLRAALILEERREELAALMTREMGKILKETLGDVQTAIDVAKYMSGEGRRAEGETVPSAIRNKACFTIRQPIGVVGIITPWNFPMAIPAWKSFPALQAGNAVILKPASDTPLMSIKLAEVLADAGLPNGVFNVVTGPGSTLGDALASDPRINMISLTGSTEVGRHVAEICGRDLRRCSLELGGKNGVIILDDADINLAVDAVVWGGFGTTGQRCTATSRVIIQRGVVDSFTEKLVAKAREMRVGNGLDTQVEMGPVVNQGRVSAIHEYISIGKEEGAKLLAGGHPYQDGELAHGAFYAPTIFGDVSCDMRIAREEIFGPVVSIIPVDTYEEAIKAANATEYGLSCAIFTENIRSVFRAMRDIQTGLVYVNAPTTGAEIHLPFGGLKASGNGHRELGKAAVAEFSETKTVFVSYP